MQQPEQHSEMSWHERGGFRGTALLILCAVPLFVSKPARAAPAADETPTAAPFGSYRPEPAAAGQQPAAGKAEAEPATSDVDGSRERLADYGISAQQLAAHADGSPLESEPESIGMLMRLLFRLDSVSPATLQRWARPADALSKLPQARPGEQRGLFFAAPGRIERVQQVKLEPRDAERFQFDRYYRCSCVLGEANIPVVVYTRHVPNAWLKAEKLNERIGLTGVFLGRGAPVGDRDALVMAAPRLAWYSDTVLGDLGVDMGLLESVEDGAPIKRDEEEIFYQLLTAVGQTGVSESLRNAQRELKQRGSELISRRRELTQRQQVLKARLASLPAKSEETREAESQLRRATEELGRLKHQIERIESGASEILPMLEEPRRQQGRMFVMRCLARRAIEVKVTNPDIRRRFDLDHYYQIDAIATLEQTVRLRTPRHVAKGGPKGGVVYDAQEIWSHPVTFCVRSLPEGMTAGEQMHDEVVVPAFFFKNWSYDTSDLEGDKAGRRVAPLLIAREPIVLLPPPTDTNATAGVLAGVLFAAVVVGIWIAVWRANRADRKFESTLFARPLAADGAVSLDQLNLSVVDEPNFRHLNDPPQAEPRPDSLG